ncbi:aspartyl protease [Piedraia hortae CBS 480.64]|uniref:Aspartyl protease n=1 Tax=Piedraia hortae CBS 480.64 TaxID=1314780 RepID=A0A6A7CAS9_9PEZI|nr:aspartyl protease [Piedraia hortae CBS 480.64]
MRRKAGPIDSLKVYNKYAHIGAQAPADLVKAAAAAQSGSVQATPEQYEQSYLCPVQVGSNTLMLDFDTGSSDLWVFSTVTPSSVSSGHSLYNPSTSGKRLSGATWKISYGDGSGASGIVYSDKVTIGGVTATSQAVEAATSMSSSFASDPDNDGLVGLAFSTLNTVQPTQQKTFFDTVKSSLASALFTATLRHNAAGTYDFGFIDSSKYTGSLTYVTADNSQGFWGFTAGGYSVGSSKTVSGSIGSSIADTGTSLMYIPAAAARAYYKAVSGATLDSTQGGYTFPCSATLPAFNVQIGSQVFTVPGTLINYAPVGNGKCFGGIQPSTGQPVNIFGDVFLKAVFAVFDARSSTPKLGFAKQA